MLLARFLEMRRRTPSWSTARYLEVSLLLATLVSTDTSKTGPAQVEHATRSTTADPPLAWIHSLASDVKPTSMVSPPVQPGYVLKMLGRDIRRTSPEPRAEPGAEVPEPRSRSLDQDTAISSSFLASTEAGWTRHPWLRRDTSSRLRNSRIAVSRSLVAISFSSSR